MSGRISYRRIFRILPVIVLCLLPVGCSDTDPGPPPRYDGPTFADIWPAAVGDVWTFEVVEQFRSDGGEGYATSADVPDLPSMEELRRDLADAQDGTVLETAHGNHSLAVSADVSAHPDTVLLSVTISTTPSLGTPGMPQGLTTSPTLQLTDDRIAAVLDDGIMWAHVDGSLEPGHQFTAAIHSGFATPTELAVRVWQVGPHPGRGVTYEGCVETFYVHDMGIRESRDEHGTSLGFFRVATWGTVVYASDVGPVYCLERGRFGPDIVVQREAVLVGQEPEE